MAITYHEYLKLDHILNAQVTQSKDEHDEMLFIVIHQVYELWFKQILHEAGFLSKCLRAGDFSRSTHTLKRILKIMKTLVGQIDVLETMTPLSFSSFRNVLETSSGFQSLQFRHFEIAMGKRPVALLAHLPISDLERQELNKMLSMPSIYDDFLYCLSQLGHSIPEQVLSRDFLKEYEGNEAVQKVILDIYRKDSVEAGLCELFVDLEEGVQEWRYRHVKMVERTIGAKIGTGGSPGVDYLKSTLFKPQFVDLWAVRSRF
jgi:tryptophan 2,3-dioxygenase